MSRYGDTVLGLWLFGIGYAIHFLLLPFWRRHQLPVWSFIPLGIVAWLAGIGLLLPFKDFVVVASKFFEAPSASGAYESFIFVGLFTLLGWIYQHMDIVKYEQLKPFLRESLLFRHTIRTNVNVFAEEEQQKILALAATPQERALLRERMRKERIPLDRLKEMRDLYELRRQRMADAGKDELEALRQGSVADITDICQLFHVAKKPHPLFDAMFRMTVDPGAQICRACVVFSQSVAEHVREPKPWFRFRQDLFDYAQAVRTQDWMARFLPFFRTLEVECYQEETDSFGVPRKVAFLRAGLGLDLLAQYEGKMFIATELENVAAVTWLEGDDG